jgi:hypothetical protein
MVIIRLLAPALMCAAIAKPVSADVTLHLKRTETIPDAGSRVIDTTEYREGLRVRIDSSQMKTDVHRLVVRAKTLKRLWPWQQAIPEVTRVARHGKQVAPLLIELLDDDPDPVLENRIDHGVQQQAALALCKIYGVIDQCGRVYCNRASVEENKAVKHYWLAKLSE